MRKAIDIMICSEAEQVVVLRVLNLFVTVYLKLRITLKGLPDSEITAEAAV